MVEALTIIKTLRNPRHALAGGLIADSPNFEFLCTRHSSPVALKVRIGPDKRKHMR